MAVLWQLSELFLAFSEVITHYSTEGIIEENKFGTRIYSTSKCYSVQSFSNTIYYIVITRT